MKFDLALYGLLILIAGLLLGIANRIEIIIKLLETIQGAP